MSTGASWRESFPVNQSGITGEFISSEVDLGHMASSHAAMIGVEGTSTDFTVKVLGRWASSGNVIELASLDEGYAALPFTALLVTEDKPVRYVKLVVQVTSGSIDLQAALSSEV